MFERQCFTGTHSAVDEVVVYKDEVKKDLVEIRCPLDYLSMREKKYQCNHTLNECRHHPIYACGFPHTEVEQEIWNVWKGTASANVSNRTAVSWQKGEGAHFLRSSCTVNDQCICTPLCHREGSLLKLKEPIVR